MSYLIPLETYHHFLQKVSKEVYKNFLINQFYSTNNKPYSQTYKGLKDETIVS